MDRIYQLKYLSSVVLHLRAMYIIVCFVLFLFVSFFFLLVSSSFLLFLPAFAYLFLSHLSWFSFVIFSSSLFLSGFCMIFRDFDSVSKGNNAV